MPWTAYVVNPSEMPVTLCDPIVLALHYSGTGKQVTRLTQA